MTAIYPKNKRQINCIADFKKEIDKLTLDNKFELVSFDIVAMYTNIHSELALNNHQRKV